MLRLSAGPLGARRLAAMQNTTRHRTRHMSRVNFTCPHCKQTVLARRRRSRGSPRPCPKCKIMVSTWPGPLAAELKPLAKREGEPRTITLRKPSAEVPCPHCRAAVAMSADRINRTVRCASCDGAFVVSLRIETVESSATTSAATKTVPREWVQVQVSARLLYWPKKCACCGGPEQQSRKATCTRLDSRNRLRSRSWAVPYCSACAAAIARGSVEEAVRYDDFSASVHTFRFASPEYTKAFREQNRDKLIGRS